MTGRAEKLLRFEVYIGWGQRYGGIYLDPIRQQEWRCETLETHGTIVNSGEEAEEKAEEMIRQAKAYRETNNIRGSVKALYYYPRKQVSKLFIIINGVEYEVKETCIYENLTFKYEIYKDREKITEFKSIVWWSEEQLRILIKEIKKAKRTGFRGNIAINSNNNIQIYNGE
ncbi:hypothetical protein [Desulfurobacterium sp.]